MSAPFNQNVDLSGLTSYSVTIPNAGILSIDWKLSLPMISQGGGQSSVVMTITNATGPVTVFTGTAGALGGKVDTLVAANDVITCALSSAAAADAPLNVIKAVIAFSQGV